MPFLGDLLLKERSFHMEKRQVLSIISLICYLVFVACGVIMALGLYDGPVGGDGTSLSEGILYALIIIVVMGYAVASVIPAIMRIIGIFNDSKILAGICIPFDVIFLLVSGLFLYLTLRDPMQEGFAICLTVFVPTLIISLVAFICNIMCIGES
jgi:hypothetical protein